ncbi:MAG TPA: choice-of-anchor D domain-containing protein, partial [Solirubrobacteraceae bacterium]|nr:choice-of-anchor D domain-containing protein [Solirubrobacteraceae bacterium]
MRRLAPLLVLLVLAALASAGQVLAEGVTNSGDDLRDGWYPEQQSLTPQLVSGGTFGQLWATTVEGQVYAQPLLSNGTLLVATENNKAYGLDPANGSVRWSSTLGFGTPWKPADIGCADLTPNIGVTSTPVIDQSTNTAYMTHKTYASGSSGPGRWYMDAIDMTNGAERAGWPVQLSGAAQNQPSMTFQPTTQMQRPGLLLLNGVIYAGFGSHCDISPWQGWIFGVSTAGTVKARWITVPSNNGAGIWQSGAGLTSDGPGTLMFSTGNLGAPSSAAPGHSPPSSLGEAVVRLNVQSDGTLKAADFFAPYNAPELDTWDADFASGGVTALNDEFFGTPTIKHLGVAVGKEGYVYLLNREDLGGFRQGVGAADKVVDRIGPYGGVWSRPAVWPGDGGWVYIPTAYSNNGFLRVYQYGLSGTGQPTISLQASSSDAYGFSSSAAVVTSDKTTSGSALVWIIWAPNGGGAGAQLRAYDPIPVAGKPVLRWSAPIGTSSKFATPGVGAGRIYVGTRDAKVLGFGSPVTPPLTGSATNFPTTTIGKSSEKTLTLTATNTLTVTKLTSSSSQFTVGAPTPALPAQLTAGQTIRVPLTFAPTQTGPLGGTLSAETTQGATSFSMAGTGQAASALLERSPNLVAFGGTTVGGHLSGTAVFRNGGGATLTINAVKLPSAPFSATGAPAAGSTLAPGASVTVNVNFDPTSEGSFSSELAMETTGGTAGVGLSGSAGPPGVLNIASEKNDFGELQVGKTANKSFTVSNTGGTNLTITKSKPPSGGAFAASTTLAEGTTLAPGESLTETVVFSPTAAGPASGTWTITGNDSSGVHEVSFTGTGTLPPPPSNTSLPTITGTAQQGQVLSAHNGSWSNEPTSFAYVWQRCDKTGAGCAPITAATAATYTLTSGDVGSTIRLAVTASNAGGASPAASSAQTSVVVLPSETFGKSTVGASPDSFLADRKRVNRYALSGAGTLSKLSIYLAPTATAGQQLLKGIVYADSGGAPASLVAVSEPLTFKSTDAAGWYDLVFSSPPSLVAGNYWIGIITGATSNVAGFRFDNVTGARDYNPNAYTAGPTSTFGTPSIDTEQTSLYATYTPQLPVSPPANSTPPTITGTAQQGQTLTEHHGTWTNEPTGYKYQWLQCDSLGASCLAISGASAQTYVLAPGDVGHTLVVQETASNAGGQGAPAPSSATARVIAAPPVGTAPPTITGTAQQGQTLTEHHGTWTNEPTGYKYQWLQCDGTG